MTDESADLRFGSFLVGGRRLALPMRALREVIPYQSLQPIPAVNPVVLGAIAVRGVLIPVLDLAAMLGIDSPADCASSAIVVALGGHLIGLRVERVFGIFEAEVQSQKDFEVTGDGPAALLSGSLRALEDPEPFALISCEVLRRLPEIPWVEDPEPARQWSSSMLRQDTAAVATDGHVMLFSCGGQLLATEALGVHATLDCPPIEFSALNSPLCQGLIPYLGRRVPLVDLLKLAGLGSLGVAAQRQVFLVRTAQGLVGLLVERVLEVLRFPLGEIAPLPAGALGGNQLVTGALPTRRLPPHLSARFKGTTQALYIDGAALCADERLCALARVCAEESTLAQEGFGRPGAPAAQGRTVLTFRSGIEAAVPLDEIVEILPFGPDVNTLNGLSPLLGVVLARGRSVPVFDLSQLIGAPRQAGERPGAILVARHGEDRIGFAVTRLHDIEQTEWEPSTRLLDSQQGAPRARFAGVGQDQARRTVAMLDLTGLAARAVA